MPNQFIDFRGTLIPYDRGSPVTWRVSIYVLVLRDGAVLFMEPIYWDALNLPGGGVNAGEDLLDAARRECWEETGYRFDPGDSRPIFVDENGFFDHDDDSYHHSLRFVVAGTVQPDPDPAWTPIPDETNRVIWLPIEEIQTANIHPLHRQALDVVLRSDERIQS